MLRLGASLISQSRQSPCIGNLVLDDNVGAVRAYSSRKLRRGFEGHPIRARNSVSNEEADVAFDENGELSAQSKVYNASGSTPDGTLVGTFMFAGYLVTWYDQSEGVAFDSTQTTAGQQPLLFFGTFFLTNGKPGLSFDGGDDFMPIDSTGLDTNGISVYAVLKNDNLSHASFQWPWGLSTDQSTPVWFGSLLHSNHDKFYYGTQLNMTPIAADTNQMLLQYSAGPSEAPGVYKNGTKDSNVGTLETLSLAVNSDNGLGSWGGTQYGWDGQWQEFIVFDNDTSENRAAITDDINNFFSIF